MSRQPDFKRTLVLLALIAVSGVFIQVVVSGNLGMVISWFSKAFYPAVIEINNGSSVYPDKRGNFVFSDKGSQRIVRVDRNGKYNAILKAGKNTFDWATETVLAENGMIFVNDQLLGEDGMSIKKERLLLINPESGDRKELISFSYPEDGTVLHLPRLFGPFLNGEKTYVIKTGAAGFSLIDIGLENKTVLNVGFPDAEITISSFSTDGDSIWFVYKGGRIYQVDKDHRISVIYNDNNIHEYSVPWKLARSSSGDIFFSDIGEREIKKMKDSVVSSMFAYGEFNGENTLDFGETSIYYAVATNDSGLCASLNNDWIIIKDNEGSLVLSESAFPLSSEIWKTKITALILLGIIALILLVLLIRLVFFICRNMKWKTDMILIAAITAIVIAALVIVLPVTYSEGMRTYIDHTFMQLSAIAQAGGYNIDSEAFENITKPGDYMSDSYKRLLNSLHNLINEDFDWNKSIYCVLYRYDNGILFSPIFMDGFGGAYYPYDYLPAGTSLEEAILNGKIVRVDADIAADGTWMYIHGPVYNKNQSIIGAIEIGLNLAAFQEKFKKIYFSIVLSVIAASVILQILVLQIIKALEYLDERKKNLVVLAKSLKNGKQQTRFRLDHEPVEFVNPTVFLLYFAFNMITAFLPMYCASLYAPLAQQSFFSKIPKEFMEALPVSAHLFAVGLGCAVTGSIIKKIGFRKTVGIGSLLMLSSCTLMGFIYEYFIFSVLFFFMGLGFGFLANAVTCCIASIPDEQKRSLGFTYNNAALFSGFNSGTVIGAALAESISAQKVFLVSGAAALFPAMILFIFLKTPMHNEIETDTRSFIQKIREGVLLFITKPDVIMFFIVGLLPYTLSGYFLFYFMPLFAEKNLGLSESVIGQLFLVHGLAVLLFSTVMSKWTARYFESNAACLAFALIAAAFLIFGIYPGLETLIIALFLLGLAASFGASSLSTYYVRLNSVEKYGYAKSMSVYQTVENSGETLAPIVFGFVLAGSLQKNFVSLALVIIIILLAFAFLPKRKV